MNERVITESDAILYDWVIYSTFIIYQYYIWNGIFLVQ